MPGEYTAEKFQRALSALGVQAEPAGVAGTTQLRGSCPFCQKDGHFYASAKTTKWDCKLCGESGNLYALMTKLADRCAKETPPDKFKELATMRRKVMGEKVARGLPPDAFKRFNMGWCPETGEWWFPCRNAKGTVLDIRRYHDKRFWTVEGVNIQLLGETARLESAAPGATVWVVEGEWDIVAVRWLLDAAGRQADIVVGVPGANAFKREWIDAFKGHHVILPFDNDEAGDKGSMRTGDMLDGIAASVRYIWWPEARPTGWDVGDFVTEGFNTRLKAAEGLAILEGLLHDTHRREASSQEAAAFEAEAQAAAAGPPATLKEVYATFEKWIEMDEDLYDGIAVCLAVCMANDVPGDPLFMYLVGPPGSGKTVILSSMKASERVRFYSSLTPASLVSGWKGSKDPSLLPIINNHCAVFKDGTEILAMHPDARKAIYGVFRQAFDGHYSKPFGNQLLREYHDLHFQVLIGTTSAIHGDNQAMMGERFLKFEIREDMSTVSKKIYQSIENISHELQMQAELEDVVMRFLLREVDLEKLPTIPRPFLSRLVAIVQIVSALRAQVDRESYGDRDVRYRPTREVPNRLAKQLAKLGQMLAMIRDETSVSVDVWRIVERVAFDTSIGFHVEIIRAIAGGRPQGMTRDEVALAIKLPPTTAGNRLKDLEQLAVVQRTQQQVKLKTGPTPGLWTMTPGFARLWSKVSTPLGPLPAGGPQRGFSAIRPIAAKMPVPRHNGPNGSTNSGKDPHTHG